MNKYIYLLTVLICVHISAEELKYECECKYAEIFVSDPMQNIENTQEDPNCEMLYEGNPENIVFVINLEEKYIYDDEYSDLRSKIEKVDDGFNVVGNLSFHGITKEFTIQVSLIQDDKRIVVESDFSIMLTDFKIRRPSLLTIKIRNQIDIKVFLVGSS